MQPVILRTHLPIRINQSPRYDTVAIDSFMAAFTRGVTSFVMHCAEELNYLYSSPNIVRVIKSRRMRWARHVACVGEERVLLGKPEGRRPLGRPRSRWVDNIRMDLQEVGCGYMDWIGLAQDRDRWQTLVSAVMNLRVP